MANPDVTIDVDDHTHTCVVVCHLCGWRTMTRTRAGGWVQVALHLKSVHGDTHAAHTARDYARKANDAAQSPDNRAYGYTPVNGRDKASSRRGSKGNRAAG